MNNFYPKNYKNLLSINDTQKYIKFIKDSFEQYLSDELDLVRVSAPIVVSHDTGLNDELSGKELPITFDLTKYSKELEIVQSLAKWKRNALMKYGLNGLYTDMNALRPNEKLDNLHSLYVDQWDWERVISKEERNIDTLKQVVRRIYSSFLRIYRQLVEKVPELAQNMPEDITFVTTEDLLRLFPNKANKEREYLITKEYKAVFIIGIGKKLSNGEIFDTRASDYDDWDLNGDILLYYETLDCAFELSSMGIRVDENSLVKQIKEKNEEAKLNLQYHKDILNKKLPLTIGGGIGQSRLCMFLLKKAHIGEVQSSYWPQEELDKLKEINIELL